MSFAVFRPPYAPAARSAAVPPQAGRTDSADRSGSLLTATESLPGLYGRIGIPTQPIIVNRSYRTSMSPAHNPKPPFWYFSVTEKYASYPRNPVVYRIVIPFAARLRDFLNNPEAVIAWFSVKNLFCLRRTKIPVSVPVFFVCRNGFVRLKSTYIPGIIKPIDTTGRHIYEHPLLS